MTAAIFENDPSENEVAIKKFACDITTELVFY
jgi:hypothetical protein